MDNYFDEIVNSLTINDLKILGELNDENADAKFKSIKREKLRESVKLTMSEFRKTIYRLEITKLIEIVTDQKEHRIFITKLGQMALFQSLSREEV